MSTQAYSHAAYPADPTDPLGDDVKDALKHIPSSNNSNDEIEVEVRMHLNCRESVSKLLRMMTETKYKDVVMLSQTLHAHKVAQWN